MSIPRRPPERRPPAEPGPVTEDEAFRREVALQCLLVFLESPGDRADKIRAAVHYADELVAALGTTERTA